MIDHLREFVCDEDGLTSVEYALLLSLISGVTIAVWAQLGANVTGKVDGVGAVIQAPADSTGTSPSSTHPWWWHFFYR